MRAALNYKIVIELDHMEAENLKRVVSYFITNAKGWGDSVFLIAQKIKDAIPDVIYEEDERCQE